MPINNTSFATQPHSVMSVVNHINAQSEINKISNLKFNFLKLCSNKLMLKISAIILLLTSVIVSSYLLLQRYHNKKTLVRLRNNQIIKAKIEHEDSLLFFKLDVPALWVQALANIFHAGHEEIDHYTFGHDISNPRNEREIYAKGMRVLLKVDEEYEDSFIKSGGNKKFRFLVPFNSQLVRLKLEEIKREGASLDDSEWGKLCFHVCDKKIKFLNLVLHINE